MKSDGRFQLLNSICHCYVNRLDPVPRLIHLLNELPNIIARIITGISQEKRSSTSFLDPFTITENKLNIKPINKVIIV